MLKSMENSSVSKGQNVNYLAWATNLGIIGLVAFVVWFTHSFWALFGLVFLCPARKKTVDARCPKCGCEFVAKEKGDEDDE